ncbi:MAG TPA: M23 family metallopeptidase [Dehalococcoidia bacterium]|nr:M23 family metallopeptidase [Dehalococcoidia bacterium]
MLVAVLVAVAYTSMSGGAFRSGRSAFAAPITGLSLPGVSSSIPATDQSVLRPPAINKTLRAEQPVSVKQQEVAQQLAQLSATPTAQATVVEDAVVRAAAVAPPPNLPPYQVYQVKDGDTVSSIAAKFGISPDYIIANNVEIQNADFLTLGQSIIIPAGDGILHEVRYGETLSDIAARYRVNVADITSFAANHISTPDSIKETQLVFVPNGKPLPVATPAAVATPGGGAATRAPESATTPAPGGGIVGGGARSRHGLIWPVHGPISSYYGPSHPLGIDIDGFNLPGAPIAAATAGTVTFAGGNACCSYGLYVVVMSPDGIETLYAHLSAVTVTQGESVAQGEQVGVIGSTGYSTGRHLHFEVIDNGVRQNPLDYLP